MNASVVQPIAVTIEEAAKALSMSRRSICRMLDAGALPKVKILGSVRIPYTALLALMESPCRTDATGPLTGGSATRTTKVIELAKVLERHRARKQKSLSQSIA